MNLPSEQDQTTLVMPAWANPANMTDEEFRASKGAAMARLMGFTAVIWTEAWDCQPVRRIVL